MTSNLTHETYGIKYGTVQLVYSPSGAAVYLDRGDDAGAQFIGVLNKTWRDGAHLGWTFQGAMYTDYANARQAAYDLIARTQ